MSRAGAGRPVAGGEASPTAASWPPADGTVVCVGETMAALAPEPPASLDTGESLRLSVAGAESNVAMYLADLGVSAVWLSALGDDPFGRRVRTAVAAANVDVSGVRSDPHRPTGLLVKDPGPTGTRVHYYRRGSAASALGPELLDDPRLGSAALVHLTGVTPALSPSCGALVERALATPPADRTHAISFDVNHRPALWPDGTAATVLRALADRADIVFVGLDEAQHLWGADLDAGGVRELLPRPRLLVVKDGGRAATAFGDGPEVTVPAPRAEVVEPVGAGDAFAAGFLAGLLRGGALTSALRLGHITAGSALRVTGDHGPLPDAATVERLLGLTERAWAARA
ncbi:sugar kinase [Streptomyces rapamycinicus]|uniref:Carbohydrate kinase n=2 Tax=Streptomyces rapamycinicus TaxID=1226757 RepID=A0A0A0NBZ5_STRRN|nr:carbohydrate kinase [Streptomyces rapamycinicus NRRL 5491]MBB4782001.1 2-dehydro-3-deoxygluconokinase [Streptomyces rapamycinicus]RLV73357.1 carbohydrate kinase [Streptomyces rapamycinicus NRRL 5491]UTO62548.1 sugar kinase [Streptomyces rapamycinicus]UTP30503.1 sugar kinase [Streptomyces rapamycinicus NRRL 5491]